MDDVAQLGVTPGFYERSFGFVPDRVAGLIAMCSGAHNHRILGELALAVAERLGAVIDMGGLILPNEVMPTDELLDGPWSEVRPRVAASTATMPGTALPTPYFTGDNEEWGTHTVDAEFLRAWLSHPDFHMIK